MEAESCGHTFMDSHRRLAATAQALETIGVEDINAVARELCEHLSHIDPRGGVRPSAVVACAPMVERSGAPFVVTEAEIAEAMLEALSEPVEPLVDMAVPDTLISREALQAKALLSPPSWAPLDGKASKEGKNRFGIVQRRLTNGLRVNLMSLNAEPQRACVRLYVPGGRLLEKPGQEGSVLIGARTIQEGGAFLDMSREEVELFCIGAW